MLKPVITIIIPAYNAEKTIGKCITSIINQSYTNFELIVVNDGSTDDTKNIIHEFCKQDSRIKYIMLQKNLGVGNARNVGMKIARGNYLAFVDSDDWVSQNFYEALVCNIRDSGADISIVGIERHYDDSDKIEVAYAYTENTCIDGFLAAQILCKSVDNSLKISPIVNNKLYDLTFIRNNQISFPTNCIYEDNYFMFKALLLSKKVSFSTTGMYYYLQRKGSIMHSFKEKDISDMLYVFSEIEKFIETQNNNCDIRKAYVKYLENSMLGVVKKIFNEVDDKDECKQYMYSCIREMIKFLHS